MSSDMLAGKVGRIYMPKQKVDTMALHKMKGLKRERRDTAGERKKAHQEAGGAKPKKTTKLIAERVTES